MSSDERIIFPGTLPNIISDKTTGKIQVEFKEIDDPKDPSKKTFEVVPGKESKINDLWLDVSKWSAVGILISLGLFFRLLSLFFL
jgi:hypothetical protein